MTASAPSEPVLQVEDLVVHFPLKMSVVQATGRSLLRALREARGRDASDLERPAVHAVDGVSFSLQQGEIFGLVGESGCGKTTTGRAVLRLLRASGGRIRFEGVDITALPERDLREMRPRMQIVFQDPHAALNPTMTVGRSIMEPILIHETVDDAEARARALAVMEEVGLAPAEDLFDKFPGDLSGGQKQRAVIARAIILRPSLVVADEPVAMLDMSVRARILEVLLDLKRKYGLTYLLITHDLATAKFVCDRIAIMYLGRIVESGPAAAVYRAPKHPYTKALIGAIPVPVPGRKREVGLPRGEVPDAIRPPTGCRFHPRCPVALSTCGWDGSDFVDHLEQLGRVEGWRAEGQVARRWAGIGDPTPLVAWVRGILDRAPSAMSEAVEGVSVEGQDVVVRFRPPAALAPRRVEDVTVECLLY